MGLFSTHRRNSSSFRAEVDHGRLLVYARSSTPATQHGEGSLEPIITWSIAVEDLRTDLQQSCREIQSKRRKSIFGMRRASRKDSAASDQTDSQVHRPTESCQTNEFMLQDGGLHVSQGRRSYAEPGGQPSLLVKVQLAYHAQDLATTQTLSAKVEQILYSMTSANSHLVPEQSEIWIRYALLSLQHAKVLPSGHLFDVNTFINFIQNKTTEFEAGILSASTSECDDETEVIKEIDYQSHLDENARLKALLGNLVPEALDDDDNSRRSSMIEGQPGVRGGFGGGFWISRPHGTTRMKGDSSPYGGLM